MATACPPKPSEEIDWQPAPEGAVFPAYDHGHWVIGSTGSGYYVNLERLYCGCGDWFFRHAPAGRCKHLSALEAYLESQWECSDELLAAREEYFRRLFR